MARSKTIAPRPPREVSDELSSTDNKVEVSTSMSSTQNSRASKLRQFIDDDDSVEVLNDGQGNTTEKPQEVGVSIAVVSTATFLETIREHKLRAPYDGEYIG